MCIAIAHCKEEIQFKKSGFLQLVLAALRFGKTNRIRPYPAQTQNSKNKKNEKKHDWIKHAYMIKTNT